MVAIGHRARTVAVALAAFGLPFSARTAAAQGHCTIHQLAGTYAFESHGSSTFVLGTAPPRHWSLTSAPFIMVGSITIQPDSAMSGKAWVILGRMTSGLTAGPFEGQLTALDEAACTAILEWSGTFVPGTPPGFHRERLVFVDNGREFRSMLIQSPSATMAWSGRGRRSVRVRHRMPSSSPEGQPPADHDGRTGCSSDLKRSSTARVWSASGHRLGKARRAGSWRAESRGRRRPSF